MSREKSEFLSGFGTAFQIFKAISDAVLAAGGNDNDLRRVLSDKDLAPKIADLIVKADMETKNVFRVVVDYAKSLEEMIEAGRYGTVDDDITSDHFLITGSGQKEVEITLFCFNRLISSTSVITEMKKEGFRPADPPELLALGTEHPELQTQFTIVALGFSQRVRGERNVLYLDRDLRRRSLGLALFDGGDWGEDDRFAAIRKAS